MSYGQRFCGATQCHRARWICSQACRTEHGIGSVYLLTNTKDTQGQTSGADEPRPEDRRSHLAQPHWAQSNRAAFIALVLAGLSVFLSSIFLMSPAVETAPRHWLIGLVVTNVAIASAFAILVGTRLWHVWYERRNQLAGSRIHMQLVRWFAVVAVIPAIIAFLFTFTVLRTSLNNVFGERIEAYHQTARDIANELVQYNSSVILDDMLRTATDIHRNELNGLGFGNAPIGFRRYLSEVQLVSRGFSALYLLDSERNIIARIESEEGTYALPRMAVFDQMDRVYESDEDGNVIRPAAHSFGANNTTSLDMWRGVLKIPDYGGGYLVVYKTIDPGLASRMKQVRLMAADWGNAIQGRRRLERVFVAGYVVLGITILFGAVWLALGAATQIVSPIGRLVGMADRVSSGDLAARVSVYKDDGEVGELARSMNRMTAQLQTQRSDLIETNRQFDQRRQFTEAVLSGVSAGVLGVGSDGRVTLANRSSADLLGFEENRMIGMHLSKLVPEIEPIFEEAIVSGDSAVGGQVDFLRSGRTQTFNVRIVREESEGARNFVVTLDDITQLIGAQRNAAWGDVARRIAHEIKNPLTPIQLSAERLRRKYLNEITSSPEVFDKCTDTIIRQVHDIGRMVDEFSSFARMPAPVINCEDVRELAKSATFPQRVTYPEITFDTELPDTPVLVDCDGRLIVQALTNLIKNAAESIGARLASKTEDGSEPLKGRVLIQVHKKADGFAHIEIIDNGIGLPSAQRHRMAEPYMTTREKGTGLGLAIVKKVAEEHGGLLSFEDDTRLGPTGASILITLPLSAELQAKQTAAE